MCEVDLDVVPLLQSERTGALVGSEAQQAFSRDDVPAPALSPGDALQLAELLQRIDAHVGVGADAEADAPRADPLHGHEAVAQVRLSGGTDADPGAGAGNEVELGAVRMRRMDDRRAVGQATG